ncbi:glucokinase [Sansalvadorimonas sp. 2012CJ34-2]|uniref:Glucokinase n=1 Tax=Parendozoicomonas callyspongiae TaxID=2942213 RepID=A0ABT0PF05_9GAMM|nr:glucokinase [Sansalvadorimonas sp. 2012CJ34-2]MCL6269960.1 glucokinase [Sansalvadorimonas sp. 2012CJ34-2]
MSQKEHLSLIGDIGGTNARFALVSSGTLDIKNIQTLPCADFAGPEQAIRAYLSDFADGCQPERALLAFACPVHNDFVNVTNNHWAFSQAELKNSLELQELRLVNDFYVQAMAMPYLKADEKLILREGTANQTAPRVVMGPGTGLGMATLVPNGERWQTLPGEGGHTNLPVRNDLEGQIASYLRNKFGIATCEHVLCGPGLENLFEAYSAIHEWGLQLKAPEITSGAHFGDEKCLTVINHFLDWMGCVAGNAALVTGSLGGVYLAGGVLPRMKELLQSSTFLDAFNDKGCMRSFTSNIPVTLNLHSQSGLLGAAAALL